MSRRKLDPLIAVAQMKPKSGDIAYNLQCILAFIAEARRQGKKIVVFPELSVSGYLLGDRLEDEAFIADIEAANEEIRKASVGMVVVWGSIRADHDRIGEDGRLRKYNAALIAKDGQWIPTAHLVGWIPKTNLPKYRFFDDARHFYPAAKLAAELGITLEQLLCPFNFVLDGRVVSLALAICEDLWEDEYNTKVSKIYRDRGVDLIIDLSQSPWTAQKWKARDRMLQKRARDSGCAILYVNSIGLQNNSKNLVWFDGASCLMGEDGRMRWRAPRNREGLFIPSERAGNGQSGHGPGFTDVHPSPIQEKYEATVAAIREFYQDFKCVVIGLSGGIDSAVSLAMHVRALGKERVLAINMPMPFNSPRTRSQAELCARNFGVEYRVGSIEKLFEASNELMAVLGYPDPSSFDRENEQARLRGKVLAYVAACESTRRGGRCGFSCNGNKTEVALNYFTEYGDGAGTAAFFADYWKGEIYELARYINMLEGYDAIPQGIIDVVPSAELSADQNVDEGKGDPIIYAYHDPLLKAFIEWRWDPTVVVDLARKGELETRLMCPQGTIEKFFPTRKAFVANLEWAWRQYSYEGKRHKLPPALVTSRRAFGYDRRETIADANFTVAYKSLRDEYLAQAA